MKKICFSLFVLMISLNSVGQTIMQVINQSPYDIEFSVQTTNSSCVLLGSQPYIVVPSGTDFTQSLAAPNFSVEMIRIRPACTSGITSVTLGNPCNSCLSGLPGSGIFSGLGGSCPAYGYTVNWVRCLAPSPQINAVIVN